MRALTKAGPGRGLHLREVPRPEPAAGEVLIKVHLAGICGTDLSCYDWLPYVRDLISLPRVLGHEFVGTVVAVGAAVDLPIGARVTADTDGGCGVCRFCRRGVPNACERQQRIGTQRDGALAEYLTAPARSVHVVPEQMDDRIACLLEPFGAAVHAVEQLPGGPGGTGAVVGPGPVGLLAAVALRAAGCGRVLVVGLPEDSHRLAVAAEFGFVPVAAGEAAAQARGEGSLGGVDLIVDAVGSARSLATAVSMARFGTHIAVVGLGGAGEFDVASLVAKELHVHGSWRRTPTTWDRTLALAAANPELAGLVSAPFGLADYGPAFAALRERRHIKTAFAVGA